MKTIVREVLLKIVLGDSDWAIIDVIVRENARNTTIWRMAMSRSGHMHIKWLATFRILAKGENSTASKYTVGMFLLEVQEAECNVM